MNRPITVLVVDDNRAVNASLCSLLSEPEFQTLTASRPSDAISLIQNHQFDVLITDIWLPEIGGIELIKAIRKVSKDVKVFAVTGGGPGISMESASHLAILWGADQVFFKPFDEQELLAAIRTLCS